MKLESLRSSKFDDFKNNELQNPLKVVGGRIDQTTYQIVGGNGGRDWWRTGGDIPPYSTARYSTSWDEYGEVTEYTFTIPGNDPEPSEWTGGDYCM